MCNKNELWTKFNPTKSKSDIFLSDKVQKCAKSKMRIAQIFTYTHKIMYLLIHKMHYFVALLVGGQVSVLPYYYSLIAKREQ